MKLLIADDELPIRSGLKNGIDWHKLGIDEVYTAEDGTAALSICKTCQPEIIITDIRMPGLSGLELAEQVANLYQVSKIILLSGYSDFAYAQKAIRLGVVEYLLKPVKIAELSRIVRCAVEAIGSQKDSKLLSDRERIKEAISGRMPREKVVFCFAQTGFETTGEVVCGIAGLDRLYRNHSAAEAPQGQTLWQDIALQAEAQNPKLKFILCEEEAVFLMRLDSAGTRNTYLAVLENTLDALNAAFGQGADRSVSFGISARGQLADINGLYMQAQEALKHRLYKGAGCCLVYDRLSETGAVSHPILQLDEHALEESISAFRLDQVKTLIARQFAGLAERRCIHPEEAHELCVAIKNILFSAVRAKGIDLLGILEKNQNLFNTVPAYDTLSDYEEWIGDCCFLLLTGLECFSEKRHSAMMTKAVDYINQHFAEDLNLKLVAEYVDKSANYFSYIFKKEIGISFNEYLNTVRIRNAKRLLDEIDYKVYEVSQMTGFSDYKYFTQVLKKLTGVTPAKYRQK